MQPFNLPLFLTIEENSTKDLIAKLGREFSNIESKKIMVFTSKGIYEKFKRGIDRLLNDYKRISIFYVEDSTYDIAVEVAKRISIEEYEIVIGFGGGKILDTAKYASYVSKKKYVAIPTTLSNDGVASPIAVLKTYEGKSKSFGCKSPDGIIIDTNIIKDAPNTLLMAGIGDTVSNYTALYDWKLESKHKGIHPNDFAYLLSDTALNMLLFSREEHIRNENFIKQLAQSLVLSGLAMDIAGNSRPCSGSEHLFSHSLDEHYNIDAPHGLKVALGSIASCILQDRSYEPIVTFLKRYNVNILPEKLGVSKEVFVDAWLKAQDTRPDRFSVLNTLDLHEKHLEKIYDEITEVLR
ncbi:iron-containing alcohol dehydrogenase family protein [Asaccharospora irregularis]|uniref:Glycerol-1-phosphate dehydrogenase [NAD(P)+] n=1 Tax=Asaccharospora irregularis DSM 2635 TaxID=1121321 RepID=A0A1M5SXQ3_9FIRM|nr:iron-containing alcohol dehydrogenase family protein [Asaccharospora irregularis]SHH43262.1 glycerol-1-phosphate dehydrogenase [NAD(P)+] [Asaccharospora irregularis DSM 2635]